MSDDRVPVAHENSTTNSVGSKKDSLDSSPAFFSSRVQPEPTLYRKIYLAHLNEVQVMSSGTGSLNGDPEPSEKLSMPITLNNPVSKDKELGISISDLPRQSRLITKESTLSWYIGILGNVSLRTKSKVIHEVRNVHIVNKPSLYDECIFIFRPSFLKKQYELRLTNGCGLISRSLTTDCVVDFKAPVFEMCRLGDIRGLRQAFSGGSTSLNVVDPFGMGLLHVSTFARPSSSSSDTR